MSENSYVYRVEVDVAAVRADKHKDTEEGLLSDLFELYQEIYDVTPPSISGENPATLCRHPIQKVTPKQIRVLRAYERLGEDQCVCSRRSVGFWGLGSHRTQRQYDEILRGKRDPSEWGRRYFLDRGEIEEERVYYHRSAELIFYMDRADAWSVVQEFTPESPGALQELGLDQDATPKEVKRAFRQQAKEVHPDHGGDKKEFVDLQESYEIALEFVS